MWPWLIGLYVLFSAALAWRATGVAIHSTDPQQRKDAWRVLAFVWGGGTAGSGIAAAAVRLYELGVFP
ncbi:hypothetical protein [Saccharothrix deserti]|uniref:hypothetical protein n=1 Tax=Saccharothrix deserti TaxID=2593674 RepID=UPI00131AE2F8|nr:hypothetical protein [Saccharothrix deserti]